MQAQIKRPIELLVGSVVDTPAMSDAMLAMRWAFLPTAPGDELQLQERFEAKDFWLGGGNKLERRGRSGWTVCQWRVYLTRCSYRVYALSRSRLLASRRGPWWHMQECLSSALVVCRQIAQE